MTKFLQWLVVALFLSFSMVSFAAFADDGGAVTEAADTVSDANDDAATDDGEAGASDEVAADGDNDAAGDGASEAGDDAVSESGTYNTRADSVAMPGAHGKHGRSTLPILALSKRVSPPPRL